MVVYGEKKLLSVVGVQHPRAASREDFLCSAWGGVAVAGGGWGWGWRGGDRQTPEGGTEGPAGVEEA